MKLCFKATLWLFQGMDLLSANADERVMFDLTRGYKPYHIEVTKCLR